MLWSECPGLGWNKNGSAVTNVVGVFGTTNIGRSGSRAWVDLVFWCLFGGFWVRVSLLAAKSHVRSPAKLLLVENPKKFPVVFMLEPFI